MAAIDIPKISLLTYSSCLNNTSDNQGDHCIIAHCESAGKCYRPGNQTTIAVNVEQEICEIHIEEQYPQIYQKLHRWLEDGFL